MAIVYELSNDPFLLAQYYRIRESCFRAELGLSLFDGSEDHHDVPGQILIIREGDVCLGGVRVSGYTPGDYGQLPVESSEFLLRNECSDFLLAADSYCQWSRLAIKPEFRNRVDVLHLCEKLIEVALSQGYLYSFYVTGSARTRLFQKLHLKLGCKYEVLHDVLLPVEEGFESLPHLLSVARLDRKAIPFVAVLEERVA
ncbi:hypothetical protein [Neptunomonas sp.]|uniref:hypothetical protein n=1 Tax=Neptunomonas sp. TaxID=1971898 RepID=UPI0025CF0CDA|nr:hypothetical protein [Neptunomonas sp.]